MEPGVKLAFELNRQQGGALVTKHATYREDIERRYTFEKYIKRYYDSWLTLHVNRVTTATLNQFLSLESTSLESLRWLRTLVTLSA